ncbi:hypothetical protein N8920_04930 [Opitutales bacterium]|nr:hypothetical protein [Opitutales bacterium]MDA8991015.1 hypothetical protein [Opitutales bacterium]
MKYLIRLSWMLLVLVLFNFSCTKSNNPYRSDSNLQNLEMHSQVVENAEKVPVLRKLNLQTLTIGKNRIEIEELIGPPEGKSLDGGNGFLWDYRRPVYDEATNKVYGWSLISFKFLKGLCSSVNIRLETPPLQLTTPQPEENVADNNGESP